MNDLKSSASLPAARQALAQRWQALSAREKRLITWAAALLGVALVWWVALAPALRTVRQAPAQQAALDAQWQALKDLQAQAQSLQNQPRMSQAEALRALQNATTELLGASAQLQTVGERSTITFKAVPAATLASWLARVRTQARAVPTEAHWQRSAAPEAVPNPAQPNAAPPSANLPNAPTWSGSVVLSLPAP